MIKLSAYIARLPAKWRVALECGLLAILFVIAAGVSSVILFPAVPVASASVMPAATLGIAVLSGEDQQHYKAAFAFQQAKNFAEADAELAQVSDPILKNITLVQRSSESAPALANTGFSSGGGRSMLHTGSVSGWTAGLAAFRKHEMQAAAEHFRALLNKDLSSEDRATAAFWTYRALAAAGNADDAMKYARQAANQPPSFYSILARHVVDASKAEQVSTESQLETLAPLLSLDGVRRTIALKEIGQDALAEQELRTLANISDESGRERLSKLAAALDLPAAQMQMALQNERDGAQARSMIYPMPHWKPVSGYHIEPALLFAIMRQESGFNPNARSLSGATGVMQLMPATALAMEHGVHMVGRSTLPAVSMALGQSYIERLMESPGIGDNLVYLTAAYNAGPGMVANWQHNLHLEEDPLLFIESMPFAETRDYVVHVIGNYWVYSQLMGGHNAASVEALSQGQWPHYAGTGKQLASMSSRLGAVE